MNLKKGIKNVTPNLQVLVNKAQQFVQVQYPFNYYTGDQDLEAHFVLYTCPIADTNKPQVIAEASAFSRKFIQDYESRLDEEYSRCENSMQNEAVKIFHDLEKEIQQYIHQASLKYSIPNPLKQEVWT